MVLGENVLERKRETQSQIGLPIRQRQENVRGAFAVRRAQEVNGREVLLVDDVYTTSATVSEPGYCAARERLKCGWRWSRAR
jgi:predicted amidophosphoribosyltransferase